MTEPCDLGAVETRRLIGEKKLSPVELLDSSIARIEAVDPAVNAMVATCYGRARTEAKAATMRKYALAAVQMGRDLAQHIEDAATRLEASAMRMPSRAGHDAMHLARHVPTRMLFIPSIGGRSHDTADDRSEADIVLGARVLTGAVQSVLSDG